MFAWIATWAANKLGAAGGKLLEAIIALALLLALVGGPYWLGMRHQAQADDAAQARAQAAAAQRLATSQAYGAQLAQQLADAQAQTNVVYRTITKEVPHVVVKYRAAPGAPLQDVPRAVFTRGFIGVWNCALDPGLPDAACQFADTAASGDPAVDSGLDEQAILANEVANGHACSDIRQQLIALIAWHREVDHAHR